MNLSADEVPALAFIFATFVLAGFVKGVIGLGLPTVSIGLLSIVMSPAQAAAILIVPSLVTNIWQALGPKLAAISHRLWTMILGICAGTFAGTGLLTRDGGRYASVALGLALMVYAITGLTRLQLTIPPRQERWLSPLIGVITGVITGATGVFVIPAVPYLQALGLEKNELVQALGLTFLVSTVALGLSLTGGGVFGAAVAGASILALAPALSGMVLGQYVRNRVSPTAFRRFFFWGLLLLGAHLAVRGLR